MAHHIKHQYLFNVHLSSLSNRYVVDFNYYFSASQWLLLLILIKNIDIQCFFHLTSKLFD